MAFRVGVGETDFADLRRSGKYYVDKTEILYELVEETENKVTLFTRPRRFGKTLMMNMMSNFFSIRKDSREIFQEYDAAVSQIVNKKYADGLCGYTRIRCYGIAFFQKHARVKQMQ